ncbi:GNAT family N-acetyltransferase [Streptomyces chartreusis]|uniref:GNAT family N-acetyltransferase n=1 Tax=Streptomyces chartreusis TaxID=1969 RepID=UPI00382DC239
METVGVRSMGGVRVRAMEPADHPAVLVLIAADLLPGQPVPDTYLLAAPARDGLAETSTLVLTDTRDVVQGVVHCASRPSDGAGLIGWIHAHENFDALAALLATARAHLASARTLFAGTGPTQPPETVPFALPGIAEHRRPATSRALRAAGFTPATSRRYFHHPLTSTPTAPVFPMAELRPLADPPGVQVILTETDGTDLATAVLHIEDGDRWLLWHLAVRADRRHRGIGSHLLAQCLHTAHTRGASSVIAHTNEDDTTSIALLTRGGFTSVDTLTVYHRRP